jgi:hypothetical protein
MRRKEPYQSPVSTPWPPTSGVSNWDASNHSSKHTAQGCIYETQSIHALTNACERDVLWSGIDREPQHNNLQEIECSLGTLFLRFDTTYATGFEAKIMFDLLSPLYHDIVGGGRLVDVNSGVMFRLLFPLNGGLNWRMINVRGETLFDIRYVFVAGGHPMFQLASIAEWSLLGNLGI